MNTPASFKMRQLRFLSGGFIGFACLLVLMAILAPAAVQAGVTAQLDRDTINEGETFTLNLNVTGNDGGQPDVSPLRKDFEVLGTGQRNEVQIINGSVEAHRSWTITLSPRLTGKLVIPPLTVGNDSSAALAVTVLPAAASSSKGTDQGDVFIEVNAEPDTLYVQAQLLYTVRLYYAVPLRQGSLSEPTLDNAIVQKLGDDSKFATQRGGRDYQVIERRYAIFPQKSGTLEIPAIVFDGDVRDPSTQSGDPFFDSLNPVTRHVRLRSRQLDITVTAQPAAYQGASWLPAQGLSLAEKWSPETPRFRVGDPVTRTVIVRAKGLSASQLPDLPMPDQTGLKLYPDQAQTHSSALGDTLVSEREQKIAMIPTQAGDLTLPAIRLDWWDTAAKRQRSAELPARTIHVLPALATPRSGMAAMPAPFPSNAAPQASSPPLQALVPESKSIAPSSSQGGGPYLSMWIGLTVFFAMAWLITLLLWWYFKRPRGAPIVSRSGAGDSTPLVALKRAQQQHDPRALKDALLTWARLRWPDAVPLSLGALAARVEDECFGAEIARLDRILYEANDSGWRAERLQQSFTAYLRRSDQHDHQQQATVLEPLYLNKTRATGR